MHNKTLPGCQVFCCHANNIGEDFLLPKKTAAVRLLFILLGIFWVLVLGSCATRPEDSAGSAARSPDVVMTGMEKQKRSGQEDESRYTSTKSTKAADEKAPDDATQLYPGSNVFINRSVAGEPRTFIEQEGAIVLNFENTSIREVVKTILGDILEKNYVIDKAVQGTVTVQTGRPLSKEALIPVLETLLRMNNAALVRSKGLYKVMPISLALQGNLSPRLSGAGSAVGYNVRIVPLQYIGAAEMKKILEPLVPQGAILYVDPARNLLMLAGTAQELAYWQETIDIFDVNWLEGMSVGLYKLEYTQAEQLVTELNAIFGPEAATPLAGTFRFVPIERLNAVLAITSQSQYLEEVQTWIERLDQGEDAETERLYVYHVQNGVAENLAGLLQEAFGQGGGGGASRSARVAPGREATELFSSGGGGFGGSSRSGFGGSSGGFGGSSGLGGFKALEATDFSAFQAEGAAEKPRAPQTPKTPAPAPTPTTSASRGIQLRPASPVGADEEAEPEVRIIPDAENNALLILATPRDYEKIERALSKLDIPPRQVLVEATIAEVTLTGSLSYGIQWFFRHESGTLTGTGAHNQKTNVSLEDIQDVAAGFASGGFTYALSESGMVRGLLTAQAAQGKVKVLSSPQLLVLDNQTAEIRVGDQVPVLTGQAIGIGGNASSQIQFRDTGVLLTVTPRVNAGGRVTMELTQEVVSVGKEPAIVGEDLSNPTFSQRSIESVVTVQSGETIILGGLIQDSGNFTDSGVPFFHKIPIIGALFGTTNRDRTRRELIVLITPRVIRNQHEARLVTEEFRQKLRNASDIIKENLGTWKMDDPARTDEVLLPADKDSLEF